MAQPLYQAVFDTIIARITRGELKPGVMLPSETDLGKELGVSQGTARKALMELERRGIVQRQQGRGTVVKAHTPEYSLFHFFRMQKLDGTRDTPTLVSENVRARPATAYERKMLTGAPERVIEIERVRSLSGAKAVYELHALPQPIFPDLANGERLPNTLYDFYQDKYSCLIMRADEEIEAIKVDKKIAGLLDVEEGSCALRVKRFSIDLLDRLVEVRSSVLLTKSHRYFVSLS